MEFKRGRFFALDGTDGSGKATQTDLLIRRLVQEGYEAKRLSFPQYGKNIFADTIAEFLSKRFGDPGQLNPYLMSIAYAADRFKAAPEIRSEIQRGSIVITDRYTSANMGHQGAKIEDEKERNELFEWLRRMEFGQDGFNLPAPDLTLLLYANPEITNSLAKIRSETTGKQMDGAETDLEHQKRSARTFLELARSEPSWKIIECLDDKQDRMLSPDDISAKIWTTVQPYLPRIFDRRK